MSNVFLNAVWALRLKPTRKLLLVALADQADLAGTTKVSHRQLAKMTSQSRATIYRELDAMVKLGLLEVREPATTRTVAQYGLRLTGGVSAKPGLSVRPGLNSVGGEVSGRDASDPITDPYVQASRGREISTTCGKRKERPTQAQLLKLVHVIIEDPHTQLSTDDGELLAMVKRACNQADFLYDSGTVTSAINQALAARGLKPWLPLKGQRR